MPNRRHLQTLGAIRDEAVRREVAEALASADHIRRHLPVHELPVVVETLWLAFVATADDPHRFTPAARRVLVSLAAEGLHEVGGRLDIYSLLDPPDPSTDAPHAP